jgi:XTP/dITP diphosphohydrolase
LYHRTVIALLMNNEAYFFEGEIKGHIIDEKRGSAGFGYDPVFVPEGYDQTFAELGEEIKNRISHRSIATQKLVDFLFNLR